LADSPWPMAHHNPQNTGRSQFDGPIEGDKIWQYGARNAFWAGIALASDSTIYTVGSDTNGMNLFALNPAGKIKFKNLLSTVALKNRTAPLVRSDGSIVCYDGYSTWFAYNSEGSLLWKNESGYFTNDKSIKIDKDGSLYFLERSNTLIVLNSNGDLSWEFHDERISGYFSRTISFSPDGETIYIPGDGPGQGVAVASFDINSKQIKWTLEGILNSTAILVDYEGNIYFETLDSSNQFKSNFYSFRPGGTLRWTYNNPIESSGDNSPTIDKNGNLYFGRDTLYSVNYQGNLRWKIGLDGFCDAPILCDNSGNIYLTTRSTDLYIITVYKISNSGNILWSYTAEGSCQIAGSSAIGYANSITIPIIGSKLLKLN